MSFPYQDPSLSIETRVKDLLSRMTLEEKLGQLHALWLLLSEDGEHTFRMHDFASKEKKPSIHETLRNGLGQVARALGTHSVDADKGVRAFNRLQKTLVEETRLGIPAMNHEEVLVGLMARGATLFPSALNHAASWNPELVERAATAIGKEARSAGCHHALAPVLDVSRDVRWGRTEETLGEDPYLVGVLATRFVRGLQGEKRDMLATLKHFAGHSFSEGGRNHAPVHLGFRELNDVFLLPFEMAVRQANAGSVMPAYHDIDNEPCHSSKRLLTEILREKWGFDGIVVADYIGINLLSEHHGTAADFGEAAAQAFNAGLDIETPGGDCVSYLPQALAKGQITMEVIDGAVTRVLREKFRLGLFEHPYVDEKGIQLQTPETRAVALELARQSLVLLENRGVLPLLPADVASMAVIGPTADDPMALLGGYSLPVHLIINNAQESVNSVITPLQAIRSIYGEDHVRYEKGCSILDRREVGAPVFPGDADPTQMAQRTSPVSMNTSGIEAAALCAASAQVAVVFVGDLAGLFQTGTVGEGSDAETLVLPGVQQQLLAAVVDTGTPTIVVMTGGRPYNLGGLEDRIAGLVMGFAPGQEGGTAIAELLAGIISPMGRMPLSVPLSVGAVPYYYNHKMKSAGTPIAFHFGSRYPFGCGQSYTRFEYRKFECISQIPMDGQIAVSCEIENVGSRSGREVVQVYIKDLLASVVRPVRELKAFARVDLEAGQSAKVQFTIPTDMLSFTGSSLQRVIEPGEFEIMIGASSSDIRLQGRVILVGEMREISGHWRMESQVSIEK